jgi:hypothetical protein
MTNWYSILCANTAVAENITDTLIYTRLNKYKMLKYVHEKLKKYDMDDSVFTVTGTAWRETTDFLCNWYGSVVTMTGTAWRIDLLCNI